MSCQSNQNTVSQVTIVSNKLNRRQVREKIVQTLFQLNQKDTEITVDEALAFALEAGNDPEKGFENVRNGYLNEVLTGIMTHQMALNERISSHLTTTWTLERIAKIDLAILQLALYEMLYVDNERVPSKVAVNEAIELTKIFSDEKSSKFVAGILMKQVTQEA